MYYVCAHFGSMEVLKKKKSINYILFNFTGEFWSSVPLVYDLLPTTGHLCVPRHPCSLHESLLLPGEGRSEGRKERLYCQHLSEKLNWKFDSYSLTHAGMDLEIVNFILIIKKKNLNSRPLFISTWKSPRYVEKERILILLPFWFLVIATLLQNSFFI